MSEVATDKLNLWAAERERAVAERECAAAKDRAERAMLALADARTERNLAFSRAEKAERDLAAARAEIEAMNSRFESLVVVQEERDSARAEVSRLNDDMASSAATSLRWLAERDEALAERDEARVRLDVALSLGSITLADVHAEIERRVLAPVVRAGDPIEDQGVIIGHALADAGAGDAVMVSLLPLAERPLEPVPSPVALAWAAKVF